mmetsp:Transcript_74498/g.193648  ORF Transcript_74498/g.193648 Transcript_74498/m.193648 type:complete len:218 (+) Transcript_74498:1168-1821(+)
MSRAWRSSQARERWPGLDRSSEKYFFAVFCGAPMPASSAATNSDSSTRPTRSTSMHWSQACTKLPYFPTNCSLNTARPLKASGSMSLKVAPARPSVSCSQSFLTLPVKLQCSMTIMNLPKVTEPCMCWSSSCRHAITVEPNAVLSTFFSWRRGEKATSPGLFGFPPPDDITDVLVLGGAVAPPPTAWPRCRFLVHSGSMSQMVRSCRPGIGLRFLKS